MMGESVLGARGSSGFSLVMREGFAYQELSSISGSGNGPSSKVVEGRQIIHGFGDRSLNAKDSRVLYLPHFNTEKIFFLNQVHGSALCEILTEEDFTHLAGLAQLPEADGWVIDLKLEGLKGALFGIKTADCAPVMVIHPSSGLVANLHCGWRSALEGILPMALARLDSLGAHIDECLVLIGPSAKSCCYEVSVELARDFSASLPTELVTVNGDKVSHTNGNKCFLDIPSYLRIQALHAGIAETHIYISSECTICNPNYFSFRRERAEAGRQLNFLGVR